VNLTVSRAATPLDHLSDEEPLTHAEAVVKGIAQTVDANRALPAPDPVGTTPGTTDGK
jgi:hypothetical protein